MTDRNLPRLPLHRLDQPGADDPPQPFRAHRAIWAGVAFVLAVLFFVNESDIDLALGRAEISDYRRATYAQSPEEVETKLQSGNLLRRIAYPLIGLVGVIAIGWPRRRPHTWCVPLGAAAALFTTWALMSVGWSLDQGLTSKRLVILLATFCGIVGVARIWSMRDLARFGLWTTTAYLAVHLLVDVGWQDFRPLDSEYRLAGAVHPNTLAGYSVLLCISAAYLALDGARPRGLLLLLAAAGFATLLLTKSRSALVGAVLAASIPWLLTAPRAYRSFALSLTPFALIVAAIMMLGSGAVTGESLQQAAELGREEGQVSGLNGRIPLWLHLAPFAANRIVFGYGYDSFFSSDHVVRLSYDLGWTVPNSHNTLLEVLLNLGLIGVTLFCLVSLGAVWLTARACRRTGDPMLCFALALGIYAIFNSLFEASFSQPTGLSTFVTAIALCMAAMMPAVEPGRPAATPAAGPGVGWGRPCRFR